MPSSYLATANISCLIFHQSPYDTNLSMSQLSLALINQRKKSPVALDSSLLMKTCKFAQVVSCLLHLE